jgi:predicted DsbA family dithiol-disulfide isomerase
MEIIIWSDVVCPWCYLGKRRLERALETFEHRDQVQVVNRSFQLDPSRPRGETVSRREMLMAKYRLSSDEVIAMDERMEDLAAAEGLEYHLTDAGLTGNTLDAHQLVHLGRTHGLGDAMLARLFRAYFTEERSVFDHDSLLVLATEVGLDPREARETLEGDRFAEAVAADIDEAGFFGVTGVPFYVVGGRYGISGAQQVDLFNQVLSKAWSEQADN